MKKVTALLLGLFLASFSMNAANDTTTESTLNFYDGKSYIFIEGGVEFSVFPDGQFDFVYVGRNQGSNVNVSVNTPNVSISFNGGHDYDGYVQYDDYGAVIQIEDIPVYYDEYGRISQAGDVEIRYNNRRIVRVGGLRVFYNNYGYFDYCTGYVSPFYRTYVYRPWHVYYARPFYNNCVVYDYPYRSYYSPVRYSYARHRTYYSNRGRSSYSNGRRSFYRPGSRVHYRNGRTAVNRDYNPNRRTGIASRSNRSGSNRSVARTGSDRRGNASTTRPVTRNTKRGTAVSGNSKRNKINKDASKRTARSNSSNRGTISGNSKRNKINKDARKRTASSSTRPTTTKRSTSSSNRSVTKRQNTVKRTTTTNRRTSTVARNKAPKRTTTTSRSSSTVRKNTPSRSKSSTSRKSTSSRSRGSAPRRGRGI